MTSLSRYPCSLHRSRRRSDDHRIRPTKCPRHTGNSQGPHRSEGFSGQADVPWLDWLSCYHVNTEDLLHKAVKDFLFQNTIGVKADSKPPISASEERFMKILTKRTRYEAGVLLADDTPILSDNRPGPFSVFASIE